MSMNARETNWFVSTGVSSSAAGQQAYRSPTAAAGPSPAKRRARPKTSAAISAPQSALSAPSAAAPPPSLTTSAS